jgi:hypothetical protein
VLVHLKIDHHYSTQNFFLRRLGEHHHERVAMNLSVFL